MHLTSFQALIGGIGAIVTMLMILALGLRWIYQQGVSSQQLVNSVDANTEATGKLTRAYERFTEKTEDALLDHEKRITRIEVSRR